MVNADSKPNKPYELYEPNEPYEPNELKKQNIRRLVCPIPVYAVGIS
jgi:hypothetical protein